MNWDIVLGFEKGRRKPKRQTQKGFKMDLDVRVNKKRGDGFSSFGG